MFRRMMMSSGGGTSMSIGGGPGSLFSTNSTGDPALDLYREEDASPERPRYVPIYFPGTPDQQSATPIEVRAGADFGGVNVVVAPMRPRHVRGFVVDGSTGKPGENAQVRLSAQDPILVRENETRIDPNTGQFDFVLLPGSHTLIGSSGVGVGYASVQVRDADIENVVIRTMPPFDIKGRISADSESVTSADLEKLRLSLRREPPVQGTSPSSYSFPLPTGAFTLAAGAGEYRVSVTPLLNLSMGPTGPPGSTLPKSLEGAYVKSIRLGNADVLNAGLRVESPPAVPLEIVIGTNAGALEGTVVDDRGRTAADIAVVLVPDVRARTDLFKSAVSDSSGRFRFDRLPPGGYKLFAWQEVENGSWFDPEFLRSQENRGHAIRIAEGGMERLQMQVN
jgi:hypothetical protein